MYDFNPTTGVVSNCVVIDSVGSHYGAEFSPDNTMLYTDEFVAHDTTKILQYNISLSTASAIRSSKTEIATINKIEGTDLKLGPDKKIYFISDGYSPAMQYSQYMDCITNPNLSGAACGYVYHAITLLPWSGMQLGLPNTYVTADTTDSPVIAFDQTSTTTIFSVFPNPVTDEFTIIAREDIVDLNITDLTGKQVLVVKAAGKKTTVNISSLPTGTYWIDVNGSDRQKLVKL